MAPGGRHTCALSALDAEYGMAKCWGSEVWSSYGHMTPTPNGANVLKSNLRFAVARCMLTAVSHPTNQLCTNTNMISAVEQRRGCSQ